MPKSFLAVAVAVGSLTVTTVAAAPFRLLIESDQDQPRGSEVFLATYDTLGDLLSGNNSSGQFTQIELSEGFSIAGFAVDGGIYSLLIESDADLIRGSEVFLATYDSLSDLLSGNNSSGQFTQIELSEGFSVAGFDVDDGAYSLLIESDEDQPRGSEVFLATYGSLGDFLSGTTSSGQFTQIELSDDFGVHGFLSEPESVAAVPEPGALALLGAGLLAAAGRRVKD